jgi:putative transposase
MALASERRYYYRRHLPHIQAGCSPLYVSLSTCRRWELPPEARTIVFEHCVREHDARVKMYAFVVMPDHVHLLFSPVVDPAGYPYTLAKIMHGIKGASAHAINRALGRRGAVWEEESFDHVIRNEQSFEAKWQYIEFNPMEAGLVENPRDYPWLWMITG